MKYSTSRSTLPSFVIPLFLFALSAAVMFKQVISPYYFSCFVNDTYTYTSWAWQFNESIKQGCIYPRWMSLDFWEQGSPAFVVNSPLSFYITSLFQLLTDNLITSMNITKFLSLFVASMGIFFLIREAYCSEKIAFLTACSYILLPGSISRLYVDGSYPSVISLMWLPLILFFIYRYIKEHQFLHLLYSCISFGGLILTHLINAYMFAILIMAFIVYMSIIEKKMIDIIAIPVIILSGILISAAYTFPLIFEMRLLNYHEFLWNYSDLFILPNHSNMFAIDFFWRKSYYRTVSYVSMLCSIIFIALLIVKRHIHKDAFENIRNFIVFFICTALVTIFLLFGISSFLWEIVPFFKYVQYPSRWLIITDFSVVVLFSSFFLMIDNTSTSNRNRAVLFIIPFLICLLLDSIYVRSGCVHYIDDLVPVKGVNFLKNSLPAGIDTTKISTNSEFDKRTWIIHGKGKTEVLNWKSEERIVRTSTDGPVTLKIRTFNFPGWTAYIDSLKTEIRTEEGSGAILVDVPTGEHTLMLRFEDTPVRYYGKVVSLIAIISTTIICLYYSFSHSVTRP